VRPSGGPAAKGCRLRATHRQGHAQERCSTHQKGEIESMQVVILDNVGIDRAKAGQEVANEIRFVFIGWPGDRECLGAALRIAQRHEKDAIAARVEPGGLEIELRSREIVETETAKVCPTRCDEVLLFRRQCQDRCFAELAKVGEWAPQAAARASHDRSRQRACVVPAYQIAERAGSGELFVRDVARRPALALRSKPFAEVGEIVERCQDEPRAKARLFTHQFACFQEPPPDERAPVGLSPYRNDTGRIVPTPEPLFFSRDHGVSLSAYT